MRICKYCKKPIQDNEVWHLDREGNSYHYACLCEMEFMLRDKQTYNKGKADILDKIKAEIEDLRFGQPLRKLVVDECLEIIDKYRAERGE